MPRQLSVGLIKQEIKQETRKNVRPAWPVANFQNHESAEAPELERHHAAI